MPSHISQNSTETLILVYQGKQGRIWSFFMTSSYRKKRLVCICVSIFPPENNEGNRYHEGRRRWLLPGMFLCSVLSEFSKSLETKLLSGGARPWKGSWKIDVTFVCWHLPSLNLQTTIVACVLGVTRRTEVTMGYRSAREERDLGSSTVVIIRHCRLFI